MKKLKEFLSPARASRLFAASIAVAFCSSLAFAAAYTAFTYLEVKKALLVDGTATVTGASTLTGPVAVSSNAVVVGTIALGVVDSTHTTPSRVGLLAYDNLTTGRVVVSTGTSQGDWRAVGNQ